LVFVTAPTFALLIAWSGGFSWLLVGAYQPEFAFLLGLCAVAWAANIFAGPAYFTNLGSGQVAWNTLSHMLMGALNAGLGWLLGRWYGAHGVAFGYAIALVSGSAMLIAVFGYRQRQPGALMREHLPLVLASLAVAAIGWLVPVQAMAREPGMLLLGLLLPPLVLAVSAWRHPLRRQLFESLLPGKVRV
jgi:hypothetical protein